VGSKTGHAGVKALLLVVVEHVLGVQNRGGLESSKGLCWVLFEVLLSEDITNLLSKVNVVNKGCVRVILNVVVFLEELVLVGGQLDLVGVED